MRAPLALLSLMIAASFSLPTTGKMTSQMRPSGSSIDAMATNRIDEQEVSVLALHLLQASLVYVNTRMLQTVLAEAVWQGRMAPEDYRGLTPLI